MIDDFRRAKSINMSSLSQLILSQVVKLLAFMFSLKVLFSAAVPESLISTDDSGEIALFSVITKMNVLFYGLLTLIIIILGSGLYAQGVKLADERNQVLSALLNVSNFLLTVGSLLVMLCVIIFGFYLNDINTLEGQVQKDNGIVITDVPPQLVKELDHVQSPGSDVVQVRNVSSDGSVPAGIYEMTVQGLSDSSFKMEEWEDDSLLGSLRDLVVERSDSEVVVLKRVDDKLADLSEGTVVDSFPKPYEYTSEYLKVQEVKSSGSTISNRDG